MIISLPKQEKENKINSPPSKSRPRITKAYVTSPIPKPLSASKDAGTVKNNKQIDKNIKSNVKTSSILPPRAVLSSPDNDKMIGSINKLEFERSSASKKRPAAFANSSHNVTPSSPNTGKLKVPKAKTQNVTQSSPKIMSKGSKIDIVNLSPDPIQSCSNLGKGLKTGVAGTIRKDSLKSI